MKHMTLRFGPKAEKEFIIVLKAPSSRLAANLASFVSIKMINLRRNLSSSSALGEETKTEV